MNDCPRRTIPPRRTGYKPSEVEARRDGDSAIRSGAITLVNGRHTTLKHGRILLFPLAQRRSLVLRLATQMALRQPSDAQRYLEQQLRRQIAALHRRRVSDRVVERESRALESAVRAELWRLVLSPPLTPPGVA
jgi:hypothetical protein